MKESADVFEKGDLDKCCLCPIIPCEANVYYEKINICPHIHKHTHAQNRVK